MRILSDLPRTPRNIILFEPMWSVFCLPFLYYLPIYMRELGLSEVQIGIVNSIGLFTSFVFYFIAAPITNKLGRKKTTFIFDMICWGIPMVIWAAAQNFWYFFIAAFINSFVKIVTVAWHMLITEDTPEDKRSKAFGIVNIVSSASAIFTPVVGLIMRSLGTTPTIRVLCGIGAVSMILMFILRNMAIDETKAGEQLMIKHSGLSSVQAVKVYMSNLASVFKKSRNIVFAMMHILLSFIFSFNFFQVIYLKEKLLFPDWIISISPGVNSVINVLLYLIILPRIIKLPELKVLSLSFFVCIIGSLLFVLIPSGSILFFLLSMSIMSIGLLISQSFLVSSLMNGLGEHEKADAFSGIQLLTAFACIPSGYIAAIIYKAVPILAFISSLGLYVIIFALSMYLHIRFSPSKYIQA